ncbi:7714_t:CDS:2 [Scutellospora calospora]|uniref:7714_t:CDS:1 n=1 Tax=Scutellospora calospora TaxID=85575 RepID=A0ACA9LI17_9GLOM|nr:7714_t:CDS:2 [Scutellospora calospora]
MDETPVYFDIAGAMTMNTKDAKTIHIKYWNNSRPELHNSKALLVFDSFLAHIIDQIKAALRSGNTDLAVIPRGLTNKLRKYWHRWMTNGGNGMTKNGNLNEDHLIYNDDDESNNEEESDEDEEEESDEEPDE